MAMFFLSDQIRLHIKRAHKMSSDDYIDLYQQLESKSAILNCFICNQEMKRNLFAINKHVEERHQMNILKYGKKFRLTEHKISYQTYKDSDMSPDEIQSMMMGLPLEVKLNPN